MRIEHSTPIDVDRLEAGRALARIRGRGGFIQDNEIPHLARCEETRLAPCLVRCNGGRFLAPAQDVARMVAAVGRDRDWVRDVSFPSGSPFLLAGYPWPDNGSGAAAAIAKAEGGSR